LPATPRDDQILACRRRAACTQRDVVFARAALVGMAFDGDLIVRILVQPLRLAIERLLRIGADSRRIRVEEDPVADIDGEVLLTCPGRRSGRDRRHCSGSGLLGCAACHGKPAKSAALPG
jgi:hypothetical protein